MHVVVTGGTSGIGRALVHHHARHGHQVTAIGRDAARGAALRKAGNVRFLRADLSLVSENERVAAELAHADRLVLPAPWRQLTGPLFRLFAASPERAAQRLTALLDGGPGDGGPSDRGPSDALPSEGLSAYRVTRRIDTRSGTFAKHFDRAAAARLRRATAELVPSGT